MKPTHAARTADRLLEVRTVDVISGRGRSLALSSVRCPASSRAAAVEECAHCGKSAGVAQDALACGEYLSCGHPVPAPRGQPATGERALVADVMRRASVAVRSGVGHIAAADALRARGAAAAPVVDGEGRPIGIVSEAELLRARAGAKVQDAMLRIALSVPDGAPLAHAAALMAEHRVERLAVVSDDGVVVGTIAALDVVSWLAGPGGPLAPSEAAPGAQGARGA